LICWQISRANAIGAGAPLSGVWGVSEDGGRKIAPLGRKSVFIQYIPRVFKIKEDGVILRNNYAFIDSQNLNLSINDQGWKLDFKRFRIYLKDKYGVTKAFLFIGYIATNQALYTKLS
jgi:hypothetical protein